MGDYNIAWDELGTALRNEEACSRYENGYRAERKGPEGIAKACDNLKEAIKKGVYYGTINNVCML